MKRWEVKFDGANAGHVYADTVDGARRAARASYKRVHPDRDPAGRVRVTGGGEHVASEITEARGIVNAVYEGLRLLPGMELPAEKLRGVVLLLETAAAKDSLDALMSSRVSGEGGGGDTELGEALAPVLDAPIVPAQVKQRLRGLLEWVGVNTSEQDRLKIELKAFQTLWEAGLVDTRFSEVAPCSLHGPSAYLSMRLADAGGLRIERFEGVKTFDDLKDVVRPYGKQAVKPSWAFVPQTDGSYPVEVLRPLVHVGDRLLQPATIMRGVPMESEEIVAFDRALYDAVERLTVWNEGLGKLALPHLKDKQKQLFQRMEKRVGDVRKKMAKAAKEGGDVLPPDTARRDLVKFVIDQVHRIEDALAFLPGRGLRDAFGDLVFKDVVFRGSGTYLSNHFGIHIDTDVVEGADSQALTGRYRKEPGQRPKEKSTRIHSVVVPCYTQDGVAIRPAAVRLGVFDLGG